MQMKLSDSKSARWTALLIVSITMMFGYFFTDVMSPLEPLLTAAKGAENGLGLGWNSDEYGFFSGAYGYFNVFLLLLFFGGLILDKFGIRFTGILSTVLMFGGALLKWYALGHEFDGMVAVPFFGTYSTQVVIAALGFAIYGVGCEICGITVSKVIVKWFTGHELALAMGVQVATARLGTAAALSASLPFAKAMGGVSASVALGAVLLCAGVLVYLVYCVMDKKEDASAAAVATEPEEGFKFSDLGGLFKTTGFWYVAFLCLMFYAGVFPFLKFATKLMIFKYGVDANLAGLIPAMLPFGTIFLTPLFGSIYDKYGKGATLMIIGSCLLTFVHVMFALPINSWVLAIVLMLILGIAFGLVPSAMWPSVPKIIPMKLLGTAYALIFYIQNIGLALIPVWIGKVNQANTGADGVIDYTQTMTIFAAFGVIAIIISFLLLQPPDMSMPMIVVLRNVLLEDLHERAQVVHPQQLALIFVLYLLRTEPRPFVHQQGEARRTHHNPHPIDQFLSRHLVALKYRKRIQPPEFIDLGLGEHVKLAHAVDIALPELVEVISEEIPRILPRDERSRLVDEEQQVKMVAHDGIRHHADARKALDIANQAQDNLLLRIVEEELAVRDSRHHMIAHILGLVSDLTRHFSPWGLTPLRENVDDLGSSPRIPQSKNPTCN